MSSPTPPTITSPSVPDLAEVRTWIEKMIKALRFIELVVAVLALIRRMREINLALMTQIVHFRRARPRSETMRRLEAQCVLPFMIEGARANKPKRPKVSRKGRHPGRPALPAHLLRVPVINAVPPDQRKCPVCGSEMTTVGHEVCEILEIQPARIYVFQRLDERVACPHDDSIVSAKAPPQIVDRGKLGDTLIVEAVADKYIEHQPTERQSRRFHRSGVDVPAADAREEHGGVHRSALAPGVPDQGPDAGERVARHRRDGPAGARPGPSAGHPATARCGAGSATRSG